MDTKLFARIGAVAFVAVAITMATLELREGPEVQPTEMITVWEPDGDPLPAQLRACAEMGELALSSPDCRAAWADKRMRFFGVEGKASEPAADVEAFPTASDAPEMKDQ